MTKTTWLVVADKARARFFNVDWKHDDIEEIKDLVHPSSSQHDRELATDRWGRRNNGTGTSPHGVGESISPKEHEGQVFSKEVAEALEAGRIDHRFEEVILVAPASFQGGLRKKISAPTRRAVRLDVTKDLTHLKKDRIWQLVKRDLET